MPFIAPMLARPLPKNFEVQPGIWWAEQKYDGFRLILEVKGGHADLFTGKIITGWSRYENVQKIPSHLFVELEGFPDCILDCEAYVPGMSYGARTLIHAPNMRIAVFDLLSVHGVDITPCMRSYRLGELFKIFPKGLRSVEQAWHQQVNSMDEVLDLRDKMWAKGFEGLILKQETPYLPGKRPKSVIKIKKLQSEVVKVLGFVPSRGEKNDRGPFAITIVGDQEGNVTAVKSRNDAICRLLEQRGAGLEVITKNIRVKGQLVNMNVNHPDVGRELRIEFQDRTPDMSWRHPRWDRWEDE
jgi:ATP-dependent DNA ligase